MVNAMPSLKTLLQLPYGRQTIRQTTASGGVTIHLQATRKTGHCPEGMKRSTSVHSRRRRRILHLPCSGQNLWLIFAVRHWYCLVLSKSILFTQNLCRIFRTFCRSATAGFAATAKITISTGVDCRWRSGTTGCNGSRPADQRGYPYSQGNNYS